jgi:nucleoside-diphosphate-sugar epimerase
VQEGHQVVALVRTPAKAGALKQLGVELAPGDITEPASLRGPMAGCDGVFHVAAWYQIGQKDSRMAHKINVDGTRYVLEAMRDLKIPKGVYTSTVGVYGDTKGRMMTEKDTPPGRDFLSEYERTKYLAHYEVARPMMAAGLPLVVVMPGAVYGPGDQSDLRGVMVQYLQGRFPMIPGGWAMCWAHVEDIVTGHILAMDKGRPGEEYIIAGEAHNMEAVLTMAEGITGIPKPRLKMPPAMLKMSAGLMGVLGKVIPLPPSYSAEGLRAVAGVTYWGDNAKARRELGYDPRPLSAGLPETLAYEMNLLGKKGS